MKQTQIIQKDKMKKLLISSEGFSFVELLLYIAIIIIIMSAIIPFTIEVMKASEKGSVQREISSAARIITEKIKFNIREAKDINAGTSNFSVNLANNPTYQLSLAGTTPDDPIIITVVNGIAQIKIGGAGTVPLNTNTSKITNLIFTNNSSSDGKSKNIGFTITMESAYPGAGHEYVYSISLQSAAELRGN